jgi:hypothetical protein
VSSSGLPIKFTTVCLEATETGCCARALLRVCIGVLSQRALLTVLTKFENVNLGPTSMGEKFSPPSTAPVLDKARLQLAGRLASQRATFTTDYPIAIHPVGTAFTSEDWRSFQCLLLYIRCVLQKQGHLSWAVALHHAQTVLGAKRLYIYIYIYMRIYHL